ncbi:hypothetical protein BD779DRAFT_1503020 [Infundibulicybe gibba]|nr:hypothetical protein BD779DRAFT_1503020 [Infundibulicybe gibba]
MAPLPLLLPPTAISSSQTQSRLEWTPHKYCSAPNPHPRCRRVPTPGHHLTGPYLQTVYM